MTKLALALGAVLLGAVPVYGLDFGCDPRFGRAEYAKCLARQDEYNARQAAEAWRERDEEIERLRRRVEVLERRARTPEEQEKLDEYLWDHGR